MLPIRRKDEEFFLKLRKLKVLRGWFLWLNRCGMMRQCTRSTGKRVLGSDYPFRFWKANARDYPDEEAVVDSRMRLTWRQANQWIDRLALGFRALGFRKDDMLVVQLPNSVELVLLRVACERAGLLCLPVLRTWRHSEMEYVLRRVEAAGVVIPWVARDFDHFEMIQQLRPGLPKLQYVFVAGDEVPEGRYRSREWWNLPWSGNIPRLPRGDKMPCRGVFPRRPDQRFHRLPEVRGIAVMLSHLRGQGVCGTIRNYRK